jgi:hypothetical protein
MRRLSSERYGDLMLAATSVVDVTLPGCELHVCKDGRSGEFPGRFNTALARINGRSAH